LPAKAAGLSLAYVVLDLFCCAGGAGKGYADAGFEVLGVDIVPRPNYPLRRAKPQGALAFLAANMEQLQRKRKVKLIHASPPCQEACALTVGTNNSRGWGRDHKQLIPTLRRLLIMTGVPYVIEQPTGKAPIRKDITLCGAMFGLGVIRHRNFELGGWSIPQPVHKPHNGRVRGWRHGVYHEGRYVAAYGTGGGKATVAEMQEAMGIYWTDVREELTEAVPPAFTEWLGVRYLDWSENNF